MKREGDSGNEQIKKESGKTLAQIQIKNTNIKIMSLFEAFYLVVLFYHSDWPIQFCIKISLLDINTFKEVKKKKITRDKKNQNKE